MSGATSAESLLNAAAEITALRTERDEYKAAMKDASGIVMIEINPSNYDHEDVCELNRQMIEAMSIIAAALEKGDG